MNDACEAFTPCENGGTCTLVTAPDQFSCNCSNNYDPISNCSGRYIINNNYYFSSSIIVFVLLLQLTLAIIVLFFDCTVCSLECQVGYIANESCLQCILSDICEADNPCLDNEQCNLLSPPDNYTCMYTNGTNGTGIYIIYIIITASLLLMVLPACV